MKATENNAKNNMVDIQPGSPGGGTVGVGTGSDEDAPETESICPAHIVFSLCPNRDSFLRLDNLPSCLLAGYTLAREELMPDIDPLFNHTYNSCHAANLAVWSMTSTLQFSAGFLSIDHMKDEGFQRSALQQYVLGMMYIESGGHPDEKNGWLRANNECMWEGVQCGASNEIVSVYIPSDTVGPAGTIPTHIGVLTSLRKLPSSRLTLL